MKHKVLMGVVFLGLLGGCQSQEKQRQEDIPHSRYKHGWSVFVGPKPTMIHSLDEKSAARGALVFQKNCVGCHGEKGHGEGEIAQLFALNPPKLRNMSESPSRAYLILQVRNGRGNMPAWENVLTPRESQDVTEYIRSLNIKK